MLILFYAGVKIGDGVEVNYPPFQKKDSWSKCELCRGCKQ